MDYTLLAKEYLKRAFELQMEGKLDDAIVNYKLSIQYNPSSEAHTYLGWIYSMNGNYEEAIEECLYAIEIDDELGNPYNDIGSYLVKLGRDDEAIDWFYKAIKANRYDQRHFPYYNLGKIYKKAGDWTKSLKMFREALKQKKDYSPARKEMYKLIALFN